MAASGGDGGGGSGGGGGGLLRRGSLGSSLGPRAAPALRLAVHRLLEEKADGEAPSLTPPPQRRKLSFPAALHASLLGLASAGGAEGGGGAGARRRFSTVGDAVSRKLSQSLLGGWRGAGGALGGALGGVGAGPLLAEQARALCALYVRLRLRRDGLFSRKCGLRRPPPPHAHHAREVFPVLAAVGAELERLHARAFVGVARQTGAAPAGALASDKAAACALAAVARHLCKHSDLTWAKVVSLFCVAGALAVDCARQGRPAWAACLPDALADAVEEDLAPWIHSHGGWQGLNVHFRRAGAGAGEVCVGRCVSALLGALLLLALLLALALRLLAAPHASAAA